MSKKEFLTVEETANYLQINKRTVYRYINVKRLKATKIGCWRIFKKDIKGFIESCSNSN